MYSQWYWCVYTGEELLPTKETAAFFIHDHKEPERKETYIHTQSEVSGFSDRGMLSCWPAIIWGK